jgi:hypothetical protein
VIRTFWQRYCRSSATVQWLWGRIMAIDRCRTRALWHSRPLPTRCARKAPQGTQRLIAQGIEGDGGRAVVVAVETKIETRIEIETEIETEIEIEIETGIEVVIETETDVVVAVVVVVVVVSAASPKLRHHVSKWNA